ncbi:MAG: hypothetical protein GY869_06075, partial [Planctomycetes bacterium]|nr:hypothetical protein [Planctomycetota bacterium]
IQFAIPSKQTLSFRIYDITGRLVKTLLDDEPIEPGYHTVQWDGRNREGMAVGSGIYLYRLESVSLNNQKEVMIRRMTLLK